MFLLAVLYINLILGQTFMNTIRTQNQDPESQKSNLLTFQKLFVLSNREFKHTSNAKSLICLLI